jgi:hypothetical protein
MATNITFNDGGAATLDNGKPIPADRFANWTPSPEPVGVAPARQSDGAITMFVLRTDWCVSFDLPMIPSTGASSKLTIAHRLIAHLIKGGTCAVNTGDAVSSAYPNCSLRPGTKPQLAMTNKRSIEYTLSLQLINRDGAMFVCRYAEQ